MQEQRYVIVITPEGVMYPAHCWPENTLGLETLQGLVDGRIATVAALPGVRWDRGVDGDPVLLVNEEGKLRGLPQNDLATEMTMLWEDVIAGTAVLMGARGEELIGMTRETAEAVMRSWAENGDSKVIEILSPETRAAEALRENEELREQLLLRNDELLKLRERLPQWVSADERLPKTGERVIVARAGGKVEQGVYLGVNGYWKVYGANTKRVTHWMPLPEPPSTEDSPTGQKG